MLVSSAIMYFDVAGTALWMNQSSHGPVLCYSPSTLRTDSVKPKITSLLLDFSTLLVQQLVTSLALALPSFSFVSSLTFTSGSGVGFNSDCRPEWSENLCTVCDSTFIFGGAPLGLCTCLDVWNGLRIFFAPPPQHCVYFIFILPRLIPLGCKYLSLVSYSANVQAVYDPPSY